MSRTSKAPPTGPASPSAAAAPARPGPSAVSAVPGPSDATGPSDGSDVPGPPDTSGPSGPAGESGPPATSGPPGHPGPSSPSTAPGAPAPARRRRGRALRQAIFDAVFQQVNEIGYAALTMDRLAAAADTSKAVLYRHWDSKDALVVDALQDTLPAPDELPPGATLRADLLAVLGRMRDAIAATRGAAFRVIAAESGGVCRALADERVFRPARAAVLAAMRRAAERGECDAALLTEPIADLGPALLRTRALDGPVPSQATVEEIVDDVLVPLLTGYHRA